MRPSHLRSSKLRPHNSYYTGDTLSHPTLGPLSFLEDNKKNLVLGYRVNIDKFGLKESGLLKINERLSHENLLRLDGINSINLNSEHFIYLEKFDTTLDEEINYRAQRNSLYEEAEIYSILHDIGSALAYLQANQISHIQVKADAIVKVGSKYKLLDLSPFVKAKPKNQQPLAKSPLGARVNGVPASSAQENHKDNITRLAFLVLDAMNLRPDSKKPTESKLGTAAELYSGPLIKLLRKMLELNSSLRLDCATCYIYIKELYKQPISANSLVNNSFFRQKENISSLDVDVLKNSLHKNSSKKSLKMGSPSVNNRYAGQDNEKYIDSANIKEIQDYIATRDTRENLSSSSRSFDENPIASEPMELDQRSSGGQNSDGKEAAPVSMCELKNEPVSSSKQEFDKFKSFESARNPFKDMQDLIMRHNSPPNTTMKDYSTDYMTTVDSPVKTRSDRLETSPPKKVESIKEVDVEEHIRPEETLIFSEAYDNFQAEPKILPVPQFALKKPKKLPSALDCRLPTFGDDEGDDSEIDSARFASSRGHKTPQNPQTEEFPEPEPQQAHHKARQPSIIKETSLDISMKSGERSPLKQQPEPELETATEVYPDGSVYKGQVLGKMKHGVGRLTYADGSCYEGQWNQDNIEGYGTLFYANGKIGYEGEWQNNKCNGRGVMYNEQVQMFNGNDAQEKLSTWHRYEGGFCNDKWEGEGRLIFLNGDEFCGDFVNDLIHGNGIYTHQSGDSFEGEWVNNVLVQVYED